MVELQERDLRLLRLAYEQRILRSDQIERFLFKGTCSRIARRRVQRLEDSGFLARVDLLGTGGRKLIRLTRKGARLIESQSPISIPQRSKIDGLTLPHDLAVSTVRLRLEELWDGRWIPEALLKSEEFPHIPDGLWIFPDEKSVAIEVENSPKGDVRFHSIQERWRGSAVRLILYVATTPAMERIVRRYLETGPKDLPFGLVRLDALEAGTPSVWTVLGEAPLLGQRRLP